MSHPGIFRRKELAAILTVISIVLGVSYFSSNVAKARHTIYFYYLSRGVPGPSTSHASRETISIEVRSGERTVSRRVFYSPLCVASGYSFYVQDADLREPAKSGDLHMLVQGKAAEVGPLAQSRDYCAFVDSNRKNVYLFIHSDYVPTLQRVYEEREAVLAEILGATAHETKHSGL